MKVLVACEFSGIVRDAFTKKGHYAMSCDLIESERPDGMHYKGDVKDIIDDGWDMMIAHPPCTYLAVSGNAWMKRPGRAELREEALDFVRFLMDKDIEKICVENPVSVISSRIRKPDQIIEPWQFGHGEMKRTCLWLKNLMPLKWTKVVEGREERIHNMGPSPNRGRERSRFFEGFASAMADQWG